MTTVRTLPAVIAGIAALGAAGATAEPSAPKPAPVVRIAELEIDPAQLDAYKAALTEEIEASVRLEPGVLALNAVSIDEAPAQIRLLEVYASQAAYEAHLKTPHFLKYKTSTAAMVKSLRLVSTTPILLCGKAGFLPTDPAACL
ncbi:MAG: putative quinol monooxygenase [Caulobacter sp.]